MVPMPLKEVYADIVEWNIGCHAVISDEAATTLVGEYEIDETIADGPALRDEIISKAAEHDNPIELRALLDWLYFHQFAERV
jgi:hypothetical protein